MRTELGTGQTAHCLGVLFWWEAALQLGGRTSRGGGRAVLRLLLVSRRGGAGAWEVGQWAQVTVGEVLLKGEQINNGAGKKVREGGRGPGGEGAGLGKAAGRELEGPDRRGLQCWERWAAGEGRARRAGPLWGTPRSHHTLAGAELPAHLPLGRSRGSRRHRRSLARGPSAAATSNLPLAGSAPA